MLKELALWPQKLKDGLQIAHDFHYAHSAQLPKNFKRIAFFGMGGSGIAGRILKTFLDKKCEIPSFVIDSPEPPKFIDSNTLAIVITYSGNTWETVNALKTLADNFVPTIVLAHSGKAAEIAEEKNLPFILLPESVQPRAALGNFLGILLGLFDLMGIIPGKPIVETFIKHAENYIPKFSDQSYFKDFLDRAGSCDCMHVWGISSDSASFAYRATTQFNENSKIRAVFSDFPECCHNLLVGFTDCNEKSKEKPLVMMFCTDFLDADLSIAIQATSEILKEEGAMLYKPPILGDTWEEQLFNIILWSDFASYYLGISRGVEVIPVKLIVRLKEKQRNLGIK